MAKVLAPLLSGKARGQIMKSLVFFPWKSINAVRQYVVPANPNTGAQQAQRARMTAGVDEWHATAFTAKDKTAWDKLASTLAKIMSGFNTYIREHIAAAIATWTWEPMWNALEINPGATDVDITLEGIDNTLMQATLRWGTSPTFFPNSDPQTGSGALWTFDMSGLTDGVIYYYYIDITTAGAAGRTGIYKYKHVAP